MPPELVAGKTVAKVAVPQEAANSEIGFLETVATIDEGKLKDQYFNFVLFEAVCYYLYLLVFNKIC